MFYMFYIVKHFDRFPIQIYDVKHKLTLSSSKKIQTQTLETILIEKNVKSPDKSDPVLQFYKCYKLKECPYSAFLPT